jgi:hypothetical protein
MEKNKFIADFRKLLTDQLSKLYIPGLTQRSKFRLILYHLMNVAESHEMIIRKVSISEIADNEFEIKVNTDIEIHYVIGKEAVNG